MTDSAPSLAEWKAELDAIVGARQGGAVAALLPRLKALEARYPNTPEILHQIGWNCEVLGRYRDAVVHYERAIALGLQPNELSAAFLGLGSSLRCLGDYGRSAQVLEQARLQFPDQHEFEVYLAMTLHNLGRHAEALQLVLSTLIETADDVGIAAHQRAIRFHAGQLDRKWE